MKVARRVAWGVVAAVIAVPMNAVSAAPTMAATRNLDNFNVLDAPSGPFSASLPVYVTGAQGRITHVAVEVFGINTVGDLADATIALTDPRGKTVVLMSTTCTGYQGPPNQAFVFDDDAATLLGESGAADCVAGTYRPTPSADSAYRPFYSTSVVQSLSAFNGRDPNGTWLMQLARRDSDNVTVRSGFRLTLTLSPETSITKRPPRTTDRRRVTFRFTSSEPGSNFTCRIDAGKVRACASPLVVRVPRGRHTLRVRAIDPDGIQDPTPAVAHWRVR